MLKSTILWNILSENWQNTQLRQPMQALEVRKLKNAQLCFVSLALGFKRCTAEILKHASSYVVEVNNIHVAALS